MGSLAGQQQLRQALHITRGQLGPMQATAA